MANAKKEWHMFHLNDDKDWVKVRKVFSSIEEAKEYAFKHNYEYAQIQDKPELYNKGDHV